jgi:hypothetical protein
MSRDDEETRAEDKNAYFVGYREVKVGKRVKVYLTKGGSDARRKQKPEEVLAAVGEDSGSKTGARFRNAANFTEHGHLDSDSRREVSEWLDGIVAEGLAREAAAGGGGGSDDSPGGGVFASGSRRDMDAAASAAAATAVPLASMTFVNHSQEKFVFPDGRRGIRFYLVDENGAAVPAVVGEERDTRDGHYTYRKDDAFTRGPPLTCGNLIGVSRWLRDQCVNGALIGAPLAGFGSHPPKRKGGGGKRGEAGRGREGASAFGEDGVSALYGKDGASTLGDLRGSRENAIASVDPHWYADKKRKRDSRFFAADHAGDDVEPPSAAVALAEREARWAAARRAALAYAREDADADDIAAVEEHLARLRACEPFCGHESETNTSRKHKSRADERAAAADATRALDALRALEARHVNASVMRETNVCASVARLKTHADATVRRVAAALLRQWLAALRSSVGTLAASYERPPAPRAGASVGGGGARGGAVSGAAGKPPRPKPVYDAAFIASRRNEPELRRTRESRDEVMRREAAERSAREAAAKGQREAAAARAAANKAAKAAAAAAAAAAERDVTKDSEHDRSVPNGERIPSSSREDARKDADRKKSDKSDKSGSKSGSKTAGASGVPGTPLGKGRKLCTGCSTVVGSPTRVCPHCNTTLPLKQTNGPGAAARADPGSSPRAGGASGASGSGSGPGSQFHFFPGVPAGPRAAVGSSPPRVSGGASFGASFGEALPAALEPPTGGGGSPGAPNAVALYLARHQERFASCKVSQLKRAVAELAAGVKRILDAGRVTDPALVKSLRESMKKMGDVKLLQGVVERPRARREVIAHLEAAVKTCRARGA